MTTGSILLRRGPTADRLAFTPLSGEIVYDTTLKEVFVGDGTTAGGNPTSGLAVGIPTRIQVSTENGDDGYDGLNRPVKTLKRALQIASGLVYEQSFDYDEDICRRDIELIIKSIGYDLTYGSNWRSVKAGLTYYNATASEVITTQKTVTLRALQKLKTEIAATQTGGNISTVNSLMDIVIDIFDNGVGSAPAVTMPNPTGSTAGNQNAKNLLLANVAYITAETTGWINYQIANAGGIWSGFTYDVAACERDTELIVQSIAYDLIYGGDTQSQDAGLKYYTIAGASVNPGEESQTLAALAFTKELTQAVAQNLSLLTTYSAVSRVTGTAGDAAAAATIGNLFNVITAAITNGPEDTGAPTQPNATENENAARLALNSAIAVIKYRVIATASAYRTNGTRVVVEVAAGDYIEDNPIVVPDNVSVVGAGLRACNLRPLNANKDMLRVRTASYFTEFTFRDYLDVNKVPSHTFDYCVAFDDVGDDSIDRETYDKLPLSKPIIDTSPYIQNCSIISFLGGNGCLVDGNKVQAPNIPSIQAYVENPVSGPAPEQGKSMVANAFTMLTFGGTAWRVINDAYIQIVSCFQIFAANGTYCQSGGYASITNSATNFGLYAMRASGYSPNAFQFDKGYVVGTGVAESQQTLTVIGFGHVPVEDYIIRFRNPSYKKAYDLLRYNKEEIIAATSAWIDAEIAANNAPFVGYDYTGDNRVKGERDIGLVIDAVAADVLGGGNQASVQAGLSFQDLATGIYDICAASITYAKSQALTAVSPSGLGTFVGDKFDIVINAISDPFGAPESIAYSNIGDITSSFKPASTEVTFDAATDVDVINNAITIVSHGFTNGQAVIYDNNGNTSILGINDEQTYYINYIDVDTFSLSDDDSLTTTTNILQVGSGTHKFIENLQEFFVDEIIESHNTYQELTLAAGSYTFVPGRQILGTSGASPNNAYVHSYDPTTRILTVSVNKVTIGAGEIRNTFTNSSIITADHASPPNTSINVTVANGLNSLYSATFSILGTTTGAALSNLVTLLEKQIWLHRPSIVNSSAHTWEYAGSGIDYNALPQNGGQTRIEYEQFSDLPGRVYSSGTNELGDFKVGTFIVAENKTGNVTFTNKVSVNELDALKLSIGNIVIEEISNDVDLGDNESGGPKDTRLTTQLAIRSFLENRLGNFIDKAVSTNAVPSALPQLNSSGQLNIDVIPPIRAFNTVRTDGYNSKLVLVEEIPAVNLLNGDIVTERYATRQLTLSANVTADRGDLVTQAVTGAVGYLVNGVIATNIITVGSSGINFNAAFDTVNNLTIDGDATPSTTNTAVNPTVLGSVTTGIETNYVLAVATEGQYLILDSIPTYSFTPGVTITSANDNVQGTVASTRQGVVINVNNASIAPGSGYTPGAGSQVYTNVSLTGGTGTGAIADITVTNGSVTNVDLRRGGTGYTTGNSLSALAANIGGTVTTAFSITVSEIEKRLYVNLIGGAQFIATELSPNYIADNNAQVNTLTATSTTARTFTATDVGIGGSVDYATSRITIATHGFGNGDPVLYVCAPNVAIGGLTNNVIYYTKVITSNSIELYEDFSLLAKVNFLTSSSGTHSLTTSAVDLTDNTFYIAGHPYSTGDAVQVTGASLFSISGSAAVSGNFYFVGSVTTNSFTLHLQRSEALTSINGLVTNAIDLTAKGSGTITFTRQNVTVYGVVNTSSTNAANYSSLSTTNIDASNIISGTVGTTRLATGTANSTTFLRGDQTWQTVVQSINESANSPITLTGSFTSSGGVNYYYDDVEIDIDRVDGTLGGATYTNAGVAKFQKSQFTVGNGANLGEVYVTPAVSGGTIDALTVNGRNESYLLTSSNHTTQPVNKGGTNITSYAVGDMLYASGSAILTKLAIGTNNRVLTSTGSAPQWSNTLTLSGLTVNGDLTVTGTTTTFNSNTISVDDKNIELGSVVAVTGRTGTITASTTTTTITATNTNGLIPGMALTRTSGAGSFGTDPVIVSIDSSSQLTITATTANTLGAITFNVGGATNNTADGGGITLKGATDKTLNWINSTSSWTSSENLNLDTGKSYKIAGNDVLTATALGTSVQTIGTITTGTWNATAIGSGYGGTGFTTYTKGNIVYASADNTLAKLAPPGVVSILSINDSGVISWRSTSTNDVGTVTTGSWQADVIQPEYGGTGVDNGISTITLGGNLTTTGAFTLEITTTANTSVTLPTSGTLVGSSDTGTVTNTMLAGSIDDNKLNNITTAGKVANSATTATSAATANAIVSRDASGNFSAGTITASLNGNAGTVTNGFYTTSSFNLGTTSIAVNRASAVQSLTGVSIDGNAGTVTNGFYTTSSFNLGTTSIAVNRASAPQTLTGVSIDGSAGSVTNGVYTNGSYADPAWITSLDASKLTGSLSLNAPTATKLAASVTINGVSFDGSSNISISAGTSAAITFNNSGTADTSGITFDGSLARTISYNTIGAVPTTRKVEGKNGLTGGGALTGDLEISHDDTSTQANSVNAGRTYIQSIELDTYGHITSISTATETVTNTDTTYAISAGDGAAGEKTIVLTAGGSGSGTDSITLKQGTNVTLSRTDDVITINSSYVDTNTWDANSKDVAGYVAAPGAVANKVWKTDASGNPAWRDDADTNTWDANSKDVAGYVAAPGAVANKVWKTDASGNPAWRDDADTVYSLPLAADGTRGGVQIGYSTDAGNRNYAVQLSSEKMYVNVPWTDTVYTLPATITVTGITTGAEATAGTITGNWSLTGSSRLQATYADLAENYASDKKYDVGTVLMIGGDAEVTEAEFETRKIAGIVSEHPAYVMNAECQSTFVVTVALIGRVPCRVKGPIQKGDLLVSAGSGYAKACDDPKVGQLIGKSLENFNGDKGIIEILVGRM